MACGTMLLKEITNIINYKRQKKRAEQYGQEKVKGTGYNNHHSLSFEYIDEEAIMYSTHTSTK